MFGQMAVRDALGVLNGALKVASAVCSTVSVDVQRAMKSSTLLPGVSQKPLEEFNWDSFGANSFTYLNGLTNINNDSNRNLQEPFPVTLANPPGAVGEVTDGMTGLPFMQASTPFFDGLGLRKYHSFARHRCPGTIAKPRTFHTAVRLLDTTTRTGDSPTSHDPQGSFTTEQKVYLGVDWRLDKCVYCLFISSLNAVKFKVQGKSRTCVANWENGQFRRYGREGSEFVHSYTVHLPRW